MLTTVLWFVLGLALLIGGAELLVRGASRLALAFGVSPLVIGLTIVAFGTGSPEVAVAAGAALGGQADIAVGNVIGSNTFNILGCLGLSGLVSADGLGISAAVMNFDLWVMLSVAIACLPVFMVGRRIGRGRGTLFIGYYVAYVAYLILGAKEHDALDEYSSVMLGFVLPLTVVTLVAMLIRDQSRRG